MTKRQERARGTLFRIYEIINHLRILEAIRDSLLKIVPVILIGATALALSSFPIPPYQRFVSEFAGGIIGMFLMFLYQSTFGLLSIYMVISITTSYIDKVRQQGSDIGAVFASLIAFLISSGILAPGADLSASLGTRGLFTAIVCSIISTSFYCDLQKKLRIGLRFFTSGADEAYHNMFRYLMPTLIIEIGAALINLLLFLLFGVHSIQEAYITGIDALFANMHRSFWSAALYIFMVHFLWFFGIHGGNAMDAVGNNVFEPSLLENRQAVLSGAVPTEIFSKTFFDVFVLMGGCGSTMCLLLAILLFEKKRSLRSLAKAAAIPAVININEMMVFGVPIIYNPIMLIPFFLTPILCLLTSAAAMRIGWVPVVTEQVQWTTPIFFGGYYATGSVRGAVLQLFNLCLGIAVYLPFVRLQRDQNTWSGKEKMEKLVRLMQQSEHNREPIRLLNLKGEVGMVVRSLADDLEQKVGNVAPTMYYQPQFDRSHRCIGAEALLRWNHPLYGFIYPPLLIQLLDELGTLTLAEEEILRTVLEDMDRIKEAWGEDIKISVNVTGTTIQLDSYADFLVGMQFVYPQHIHNIMLEITEQANIAIDDRFFARLNRIRDIGYRFAIDDFSMGNTSVKYLQSNVFSMVKLDGALTRDVEQNARSREIVQSMTRLTERFQLELVAEYVETESQRALLEELGCGVYQGYLYSKAIPLEDFLDYK